VPIILKKMETLKAKKEDLEMSELARFQCHQNIFFFGYDDSAKIS
jgi:hypothetical protein